MASERALRASHDATLFANLDSAAEALNVPSYCMDDVYRALTQASRGNPPIGIVTFADSFLAEGLLASIAKRIPMLSFGYEMWFPRLKMSRGHWQNLLKCQGLDHEPLANKEKPRLYRLDEGNQNFQIPPIDCGFVVRGREAVASCFGDQLALGNCGYCLIEIRHPVWSVAVAKHLLSKGLEITDHFHRLPGSQHETRLSGRTIVAGDGKPSFNWYYWQPNSTTGMDHEQMQVIWLADQPEGEKSSPNWAGSIVKQGTWILAKQILP